MTDGGWRGGIKYRSAARHCKWSDARGLCARSQVNREAAKVLTGPIPRGLFLGRCRRIAAGPLSTPLRPLVPLSPSLRSSRTFLETVQIYSVSDPTFPADLPTLRGGRGTPSWNCSPEWVLSVNAGHTKTVPSVTRLDHLQIGIWGVIAARKPELPLALGFSRSCTRVSAHASMDFA